MINHNQSITHRAMQMDSRSMDMEVKNVSVSSIIYGDAYKNIPEEDKKKLERYRMDGIVIHRLIQFCIENDWLVKDEFGDFAMRSDSRLELFSLFYEEIKEEKVFKEYLKEYPNYTLLSNDNLVKCKLIMINLWNAYKKLGIHFDVKNLVFEHPIERDIPSRNVRVTGKIDIIDIKNQLIFEVKTAKSIEKQDLWMMQAWAYRRMKQALKSIVITPAVNGMYDLDDDNFDSEEIGKRFTSLFYAKLKGYTIENGVVIIQATQEMEELINEALRIKEEKKIFKDEFYKIDLEIIKEDLFKKMMTLSTFCRIESTIGKATTFRKNKKFYLGIYKNKKEIKQHGW